MLEWTWREQIGLLLQCGGLGMMLGMLYDWFSVFGQLHRTPRRARFVLDIVYGLLAALLTFFFALAAMDGRLHPLLFVGSAVGAAVQRVGIGLYHRRLLYRVLSFLRYAARWLLSQAVRLKGRVARLFAAAYRKMTKKPKKVAKKAKKLSKKTCNPSSEILK